MLIILEGPDGVGKTTLAQQLHDVIREQDPHSTITIIRKGPPSAHPLDEYLTPLQDYVPGGGMHFIFDRWHWGEYVYPRLTGRSTQLDDQVWWYLNQYVRRLGGLMVLCHSSYQRVSEVYHERRTTHPFERADLFYDVVKLFHEASDSACLPQVNYDWADPMTIGLENIVRTARVRASYVSDLAEFVTYVGRPKPEFLLLGDVRHGLDPRSAVAAFDHRPAFVPYPATSGHWLLSALLHQSKLLDFAGFANACDVDDVLALWYELGEPKTVALGKNAYGKALLFGIPCGVVPHPQFGRRFYHHDQKSYAAALLAAVENQEDHSKWRGSSTASTAQPSTAR